MKLDELQDKVKKLRELEREVMREIDKTNELYNSSLESVFAEVLGVYISIPKQQAIDLLKGHITAREKDYAARCKEIGVEP